MNGSANSKAKYSRWAYLFAGHLNGHDGTSTSDTTNYYNRAECGECRSLLIGRRVVTHMLHYYKANLGPYKANTKVKR